MQLTESQLQEYHARAKAFAVEVLGFSEEKAEQWAEGATAIAAKYEFDEGGSD